MKVLIVGHGRMGAFHAKTVRQAGDTPITLDPHQPADHQFWDQTPDDVDAAIIATPIEALHVNALHAINIGLPTLIEKPACETFEQAEHLAGINPNIAVGYVERANPAVIGLALNCPNPNRVKYIRHGPRTNTARPWLDVASHDIDLHHRYFPQAQASFSFGITAWPHRRIHADNWTADLITRCLYRNNELITAYPMDDLLATQYQAFKTGRPLATITDAALVLAHIETRQTAAA